MSHLCGCMRLSRIVLPGPPDVQRCALAGSFGLGAPGPKLTQQQQLEIRKMVAKGDKSAADAARLFEVHAATVTRFLARSAGAKRADVSMVRARGK